MKELDFDELDRAVNTLMGDVSKSTPPPSIDDDTKTLTIPSTLPSSPVSRPATVTLARSAADLPATRRGGRFMDVVHPSSDMRAGSSIPTRAVSRQGVTLTPVSDTRTAASTSDAAAAQGVPASTPAAEPSVEWPDPLDMAGYHREPDTAEPEAVPTFVQPHPDTSVEPAPPAPEPVVEPEQEAVASEPTESEEGEQPLSSPFLTDAKVEKRPLGSNTDSAVEEPDHTPVLGALAAGDTAAASDPEAQLPASPEPTEPDVVLPEELSGDLVSVESDQHELATASKPKTDAAVVSPVAVATGPTSIAQQYKEQPSTGDQTNGGIFDTATYHKPLEHPAKKKSSWMWVVWIIVLLILGAAGGAAAYLYLLK